MRASSNCDNTPPPVVQSIVSVPLPPLRVGQQCIYRRDVIVTVLRIDQQEDWLGPRKLASPPLPVATVSGNHSDSVPLSMTVDQLIAGRRPPLRTPGQPPLLSSSASSLPLPPSVSNVTSAVGPSATMGGGGVSPSMLAVAGTTARPRSSSLGALYYTIQMPDGSEKQCVRSQLHLWQPWTDSPPLTAAVAANNAEAGISSCGETGVSSASGPTAGAVGATSQAPYIMAVLSPGEGRSVEEGLGMSVPQFHHDPASLAAFLDSIVTVLQNSSFVALVAASGLMMGVQTAWSSQLQQVLHGVMSPKAVGVLGVVMSLTNNVAAVACGAVSDRIFRRRFKLPLVLSLVACAAASIVFALCNKSPVFGPPAGANVSSSAYNGSGGGGSSLPLPPIPAWPWLLGLSLFVGGATVGMTVPLMYELCAEMTFPVPEGTSAGLLVFVFNIGACVVLVVSSYIDVDWMNTVWCSTVVLALVLIACGVTEAYKRTDAEEAFNSHHLMKAAAAGAQSR